MWNHRDFEKKHPFYLVSQVCGNLWNAWKKTFSSENQTDDTYPTCQAMTLPGPDFGGSWADFDLQCPHVRMS